jgi:Zn-finger nucleic acid-binding protein
VLLETHLIDENRRLYIEKCKHCDGIFLDFGELEEIMESEIKKSERNDLKRLQEIKNNPLIREREVRYKKCPECRKVMLRLNYKGRSVVIIDRCKEHGYWLDSGELRQMMEWAKLEGLQDFTPTVTPKSSTGIATKTAKHQNRLRGGVTLFEHDLVLSLFRKLYGF